MDTLDRIVQKSEFDAFGSCRVGECIRTVKVDSFHRTGSPNTPRMIACLRPSSARYRRPPPARTCCGLLASFACPLEEPKASSSFEEDFEPFWPL